MVKDTSPMVRSARRKQTVRIEEKNDIAFSFDTTVEYSSDALPEWFKPLQAIVEDDTFTNMVINLGEDVHYYISIARAEDKAHEDNPVAWEYREKCTCGICYQYRQRGEADRVTSDDLEAIAYGSATSEPFVEE